MASRSLRIMLQKIGTTSIRSEAGPEDAMQFKEVREVHQSFLKGTTENIESMDIRFATPDVAVGTVVSLGSGFTSPDGVKHKPGRAIRTFVVVRRAKRWQIMQDQNTLIQEPK
jgi:uncharacterized protein (TIGR02246 family)